MRNLVIINDEQFGYHIDTYKYVQNLKENFSIIVICQDHKKTRVNEDGINVLYFFGNTALFPIKVVLKLYDLNLLNPAVFIKWHPLSFIYRLYLKRSKMVLDIRTFAVSKSKGKRIKHDLLLWLDSLFFNKMTFINEKLRSKLCFFRTKRQKYILPLGADLNTKSASLIDKGFNLVYIGTFNNRNLEKTILGLKLFNEKFKNKFDISYKIYGDGNQKEIDILKNTIKINGCEKYVKLMGYLEHSSINSVLVENNIGISFVPMTKYYDNQPPTKTFEYLANGLIVVGTNTNGNKEIINSKNGVLINDNVESFCQGLELIAKSKNMFRTEEIKNSIRNYTWEGISKRFEVLINKL